MRNLMRVCLSTLVFTTTFAFYSSAYASTYLGEACWVIDDSAQGDDDYIIKLAITDAGDNHFTLNGIEVSAGGAPIPNGEVMNGNAEVVGDQIVFSMSGSYNDSEETASTQYFVTISTATLNGTYNGTATIHDKLEDVTFTGYGTGSITSIVCP